PNFTALREIQTRGIIITAPGKDADFVSRFFAPRCAIDEDPVTGSAHCTLAPLWADKLGKEVLIAHQVSPRGGELICKIAPSNRIKISGKCISYLEGKIWV
ncbi:MAG: PhzF family phenazine biosynthesis protein, partial [Verrucomicrobiota bacterium]